MRAGLVALAAVTALVLGAAGARAEGDAGEPFGVPTFHCLGLYWSPPGSSAKRQVWVRYRRQGAAAWKEGLPMRYNPIPETDLDGADYRGSIVYLTPATTYEVELSLAGTETTTRLIATTWSEEFPVGETVRVSSGDARWRSPSPARPTPTASTTAPARLSTWATGTTSASPSTPPT